MKDAVVTPGGDRIRWVELPGAEPTRVYVHGLGLSSAPYFAATAVHPALAGHRSLLIDLLGFGISDRPADVAYTLEDHADWLAAALRSAGVTGAEVIAHSLGGAVVVVLAARHPELVSRLVLADSNLNPRPPGPPRSGGTGIARMTEEAFVSGGWQEVRDRVGPQWWSTMRLAGREALHRTTVQSARGTDPTMRRLFMDMTLPRTFLHPTDHPPQAADDLAAGGVHVIAIPGCGHHMMLDAPGAFAHATAQALAIP